MKFLSVCSGIEAASVAFNPLGWKAVAFSEIEPFPCALLKHHYPDTPNWGDMTKFKDWPDVSIDLLCGGTPCQSFSVAGLRKGLDDPRGNLMLTFGAIAAKYRPKWLVWENVPGVLSSNEGRDFASFLGLITGQEVQVPAGGWQNSGIVAGIPEAYGAAYRVLDAQYFGVAQRRRRVFVVGCLGDWRSAAAVLFERHSLQGHPAPSRQARKGIAGGIEIGPAGGSFTDLSPTLDTRAKDGPIRNQLAGAVLEVAGTMGARTSGGGGFSTDFEVAGGLVPVPRADHAAAGYMQPVSAFCIKGAAIGRKPEAGPQYGEVLEDICYTQNCVEQHAVAHTLRGEGFDAREDGTGQGTPLGPMFLHTNKGRPDGRRSAHTEMVSVKDIVETLTTDGHAQSAVAVPVAYGIRTANTSSNGWGIQEECTPLVPCIAFPERMSATQCATTENLAPSMGALNPTAVALNNSACSEVNSLYNQGLDTIGDSDASTQKTHSIALLRRVRNAIGEEAFAQWGLGILDSLQSPEVLRSALHGYELRPASFSRRWVVCCALGSPFSRSTGAMHSMREAAGDGCSSQGWGFSEQQFDELGAYLSKLSQPGAQAEKFMRDLWEASEGAGLLRSSLPAIQEARRPTGHQGQPIHTNPQGGGVSQGEGVLGAGLHGEISREGLLQQTCPASSERDIGADAIDKKRGGVSPMTVRRLVVEECEFLQGFPRGYTNVPHRGKPAADGNRYKALGNSWAVPNVTWIGRRIDLVNSIRLQGQKPASRIEEVGMPPSQANDGRERALLGS